MRRDDRDHFTSPRSFHFSKVETRNYDFARSASEIQRFPASGEKMRRVVVRQAHVSHQPSPPALNWRTCFVRLMGISVDTSLLAWIAVVILITVGLAGTVLPALPGTMLVLAGIVLGAWLDDFARIKPWVVAIIAVLAILAWVTDYLATVMGAKRAGASTLAIIGAALGTLVGIFMGLVGVLFMPFVGAVIGEFIAQKNAKQAAKVGLATWLGLLIGTVVKLVLVFMMIGIFVAALLLTG